MRFHASSSGSGNYIFIMTTEPPPVVRVHVWVFTATALIPARQGGDQAQRSRGAEERSAGPTAGKAPAGGMASHKDHPSCLSGSQACPWLVSIPSATPRKCLFPRPLACPSGPTGLLVC